MTKQLHGDQDLLLNESSLKSVYELSECSKKVCISGEGDPLSAWELVLNLMRNGPDGTHYELITSSFWKRSRVKEFLTLISSLCVKKGSTLSYRISVDEFHEDEIKRDVLEDIISIFESTKLPNVNLQIRSLTGQENYLFERLNSIFTKNKSSFGINKSTDIEYDINTDFGDVKIQFKPSVRPLSFNYTDNWDLIRYIKYLESSRQCNFHIGLLNGSVETPQFDVTINPNGDVVLYGLEPYILGNINVEDLNYELIKTRVERNRVLNYLTSNRFLDLINVWSEDQRLNQVMDETNNPFWVIRYLFEKEASRFNTILQENL